MKYLFKICFTMKPINTSFGGGNQFLNNFINYLHDNICIVYDLKDDDIDIIFMMDPRILTLNKISLDMVKKYKLLHPNVIIIHRINDLDKTRNNNNVLDPIIIDAINTTDDICVFVSEYTRKYFKNIGYKNNQVHVIFNGCDTNIFYPINKKQDKIKIVTHHWSLNENKGYDYYDILDKYLDKHPELEFIFIGRGFNDRYKPKNIKMIGPFYGQELGDAIKQCDIYITGSKYDACPMHVVEALACGLPILYHEELGGGSEICHKCGEMFTDESSLIKKLNHMIKNLDEYKNKLDYRVLSSDICSEKYYELIITRLLITKYKCNNIIESKPLWLKKLLLWLINIEESNYNWSLDGYNDHKLGAVGLFAKLATIFSNYYEFNIDQMTHILNKFRKDNNMFLDIAHETIAETRQAISGLINLNKQFLIPNTSDHFDSNNLYFMTNKFWTNPWKAGAHLSHYIFFMKLENNQEAIKNVLKSLKKYEHVNGWYFGKPTDQYIVNGIMKIFTGFDVIKKDVDEDIAINILTHLLNVNTSTGCGIYDYVYVITKCMDVVKDFDLINKCKSKLFGIVTKIIEHQQIDGGFKYDNNNNKAHKYYNHTIIPDGMIGNIHGTTLFCMALSRLDKYIDLNLDLNLAFS